jgi:hypothetical protein
MRILPPSWNLGDHWEVAMKTLAPVPVELRPSYREIQFQFRVTSVPDSHGTDYRIEAHAPDRRHGESYSLYYRSEDFSLEKVVRHSDDDAHGKTVIRSGGGPFLYYERRLPIIPDFLIIDAGAMRGRREFKIGGCRLVQYMEVTEERAEITLERIEALGSLRVTMEWTVGHPWWSRIECTENPPPNMPYEGRVVASGHLLKQR